jgi:hypothetical protein
MARSANIDRDPDGEKTGSQQATVSLKHPGLPGLRLSVVRKRGKDQDRPFVRVPAPDPLAEGEGTPGVPL